jgi:hypothetical protein
MSDLDKPSSISLEKRYAVTLIVTVPMSSRRRTALGGDVDHPTNKRTSSNGVNGRMKKLKNLKHLQKKNPLH